MKSLYDSKCTLKGYSLDNIDKKSLHKKQIIGIMDNNFLDISYVYINDVDGEIISFVFPFDKVTFDSLCYLSECKDVDKNHPIYSKIDMFNEAVESKSLDPYINRKNNVKILDFYKLIIPVDELTLVKDIEDGVSFSDNVLNLFEYDLNCSHYTSSQVICMNDKDELSIASLMFYNKYDKEWSVMNLSKFQQIENIKHINFLYNIKFELK